MEALQWLGLAALGQTNALILNYKLISLHRTVSDRI